MDLNNKPGSSRSGTALSAEALAHLRSRARELLGEPEIAPVPALPDAAPTNVEAADVAADTAGAKAAEAPATRRQALRRKTMIGGKLVFGEMNSVIDCFVRDLSDTGARVALKAPTQLPPVFILRLGNGEHHRCRIQRRGGLEIGVQFLD